VVVAKVRKRKKEKHATEFQTVIQEITYIIFFMQKNKEMQKIFK